MNEIYWAALPNIPKPMKWPVRVVRWHPLLVYCQSDDAYFSISRERLFPFPGPLEELKNKGLVALKRKKCTKEAFLEDIEWALDNSENIVIDEDLSVKKNYSAPISTEDAQESESTNADNSENIVIDKDLSVKKNYSAPISTEDAQECESTNADNSENIVIDKDLSVKKNYSAPISTEDAQECESTNADNSENIVIDKDLSVKKNYSAPISTEDAQECESTNADNSENIVIDKDLSVKKNYSAPISTEDAQECESTNAEKAESQFTENPSPEKCDEEENLYQLDDDLESASSGSEYIPPTSEEESSDYEDVLHPSKDTVIDFVPDSCDSDSDCDVNTKKTWPHLSINNTGDNQNTCLTVKRIEESVSTEDKEFDINFPEMFVRKLVTSKISRYGKMKKHGTVWNQAHACKYCSKVVTNISKHLKKHMKVQRELQDIEKLGKHQGPKHSTVRAQWDLIRNEGDHIHNLKVLSEGKGEIILGRRQFAPFDIKNYGPCPECFVWIKLDKTMYRHQTKCPALIGGKTKPTHNHSKGELRIASLTSSGRLSITVSKALKEEVFTIMTNDDIGHVAQNDKLIIALGNMWMSKNIGNKLKRKYYTSSRMRDAARLLMNLWKQTTLKDFSMSEFLVPEHFDDIVFSALSTASPQFDDVEDLKSPSTAVKLGYDIKRMVGAKWSLAIKEKDPDKKEQCVNFLKLLDFEWSHRVSKIANTTLQMRRFNKEKSLPQPEDLRNLQNFVKQNIADLDLNEPSPDIYRTVVQLAETRLLLYNKRRAGEIEAISVHDYIKRSRGVTNVEKAMRNDLSELEKQLLESQELIETRGKYGRGVPVIIPKDTIKLLKFLANATTRKKAGIKDNNPYLFPNNSLGVVRSYESLKNICKQISLQRPDKITSVNLRKYTATMSQIFDLTPQQQTWLVNHLGHSIDIHKIHYRQTSGVIERVDIAKLMLLQEFNLTAKYSGKKLSDIQLDELVFDSEQGFITETENITAEETALNADALAELEGCIDEDGYIPDSGEDTEMDHNVFDFEDEPPNKKQKKGPVRHKWSAEELIELKTFFRENLETNITPGLKQCQRAIALSKEQNGILYKRHWETIKKKVWNLIQQKK